MIREDDDFGFSLVSEEELKAHEELLKKQMEEQSRYVKLTEEELHNKVLQLRAMIMPLLQNLAKDPDKQYLYWPNRVEKVKTFIQKVNDFVDG